LNTAPSSQGLKIEPQRSIHTNTNVNVIIINKCMVTVPMNAEAGKRKAGILWHNDFDLIPVKMKRRNAEMLNDTQKARTSCHLMLSKYTDARQKVK
jgi:hypothetical protein